jgi:hypothetical protein
MFNKILPSIIKFLASQKSKKFYVGFAVGVVYTSLWCLVLLKLLTVLSKS